MPFKRLYDICECNSDSLRDLAHAAGADTETIFVGVKFSGLDLRGEDLRGFALHRASLKGALVDKTTKVDDAFQSLLDEADFVDVDRYTLAERSLLMLLASRAVKLLSYSVVLVVPLAISKDPGEKYHQMEILRIFNNDVYVHFGDKQRLRLFRGHVEKTMSHLTRDVLRLIETEGKDNYRLVRDFRKCDAALRAILGLITMMRPIASGDLEKRIKTVGLRSEFRRAQAALDVAGMRVVVTAKGTIIVPLLPCRLFVYLVFEAAMLLKARNLQVSVLQPGSHVGLRQAEGQRAKPDKSDDFGEAVGFDVVLSGISQQKQRTLDAELMKLLIAAYRLFSGFELKVSFSGGEVHLRATV